MWNIIRESYERDKYVLDLKDLKRSKAPKTTKIVKKVRYVSKHAQAEAARARSAYNERMAAKYEEEEEEDVDMGGLFGGGIGDGLCADDY